VTKIDMIEGTEKDLVNSYIRKLLFKILSGEVEKYHMVRVEIFKFLILILFNTFFLMDMDLPVFRQFIHLLRYLMLLLRLILFMLKRKCMVISFS
jgi:hypothetical protein